MSAIIHFPWNLMNLSVVDSVFFSVHIYLSFLFCYFNKMWVKNKHNMNKIVLKFIVILPLLKSKGIISIIADGISTPIM